MTTLTESQIIDLMASRIALTKALKLLKTGLDNFFIIKGLINSEKVELHLTHSLRLEFIEIFEKEKQKIDEVLNIPKND